MAKALKFKKRNIDKTKTREEREIEANREMSDLYRQNPHRFISTELGCETLTWFQDVIIYMAFRSSLFFYIATRGIGKSFIIGWIVVALAILFPHIKIVLASSTKSQARLLVTQKIMGEIYNRYPNVRKEIDYKNSSLSYNDTYINFFNGSQIVCVTSTDNARGNRCAVLVDEESVKMDQNIKVNVLGKFLNNGERVPRYESNPKWTGFKPKNEKKKIIHITSAEFQTNPVYQECIDAIDNMMEEDDSTQAVISMHWGFPVAEPFIKMNYEDDIKPEMEKSSFSKLWWSQENEGLFVSESEFSLFGYQELTKLRTLKTLYRPIPDHLYLDKKELETWKRKNKITKDKDEKIIMGCDIAVMGGGSDNTVFAIVKAKQKGSRYNREILYLEHTNNAHSESQAIRLKQLYYDFDVDIICLDCMGAGIGIADAASKVQYDSKRDMEYPAFTVFNREDMKDRSFGVDIDNAIPCIYGFKQDAKINHFLLTWLKSVVESGRLEIPVTFEEAKDLVDEDMQENEMLKILQSNIECDLLVKEMSALEVKQQANNPYLKVENNTMRKDRFSALGFANYYIQLLEQDITKKKKKKSSLSSLFLYN